MKKQCLLMSLLVFALFSCDKEEDDPVLYLEGAYENELPSSADTPIYLRIMTFTKSGSILIETFVTRVGSDERCLTSYREGTYSLIGEKFDMTITSSFGPDPAAFDIADGCTPKDQLINNFDPDFSVQKGTLVLDNTKDFFVLGYSCNDTPESMSLCLGALTYVKVE